MVFDISFIPNNQEDDLEYIWGSQLFLFIEVTILFLKDA